MADNIFTPVDSTVFDDPLFDDKLPPNYIYISHLDSDDPSNPDKFKYWRIPCYPETISDEMSSTFGETTALGRSAPVFTYSKSGPRQVQIELKLRRDWLDDYNLGVSNVPLQVGEDYFDSLLHALQAIAVPKYNLDNKAVEPPLVALRIGNEVFIKGIVNSPIALEYQMPILRNNRYAEVHLSLTITEVDPYDASTVFKNGSFRGVVQTMKKGMGLSED